MYLHMIANWPLEHTCWRQFMARWVNYKKKSRIAPFNAIITITIINIYTYHYVWVWWNRQRWKWPACRDCCECRVPMSAPHALTGSDLTPPGSVWWEAASGRLQNPHVSSLPSVAQLQCNHSISNSKEEQLWKAQSEITAVYSTLTQKETPHGTDTNTFILPNKSTLCWSTAQHFCVLEASI